MLVGLQFPFADSRRFLGDYTGLLDRPAWPSPEPEYEFVRSFGSIQTRRRGGLLGWVGENEICEADRALRFDQIPTYVSVQSGLRVPLQCAFRRLFFDGLAVGKFEVGINTKVPRETVLTLRNKKDSKDFLEHVLRIKVSIRNSSGEAKTRELGRAGQLITQSYAAASTITSRSISITREDWWVLPAPPLLLIEQEDEEHIPLPSQSKTVAVPKDYGFELTYCLIPYAGKQTRAWVFTLHFYSDLNAARTLRLYLLRLHAEHECLRLLLRNIENGRINAPRGTEASENLQDYLNQATRKINRWESRSEDLVDPEIAKLARTSEDLINPGRRDALLERLRQVGIRKNVFRKVEKYTDEWKNTSSGDMIVQIYEGIEHMGDRYEGGRYEVSGEEYQIGAVGEGAHVHDVTFNQKWEQAQDSINLSQLAQELSVLRMELRQEATAPEHDVTLGEIAQAEAAAKANDGPKALEHLARTGKWALNAATTIGATVAAAALRAALGLP